MARVTGIGGIIFRAQDPEATTPKAPRSSCGSHQRLDLPGPSGHHHYMDLRALLIGTVFAAMWSSAFATARVIVAHAPPLGTLSVRFLISGLLAVLVAQYT